MSFPSGLVIDAPALAGNIATGLRVRASESFVAANGTLITALAKPWTKHITGSGNTAAPAIDTNLVHNENVATGSLYYRADWVPTNADYDVSAYMVMRSDNNAGQAGPAGRIDIASHTMYYATYQTTTDGWQLVKRVTGTGTTLGTQAFVPVVDQSYFVMLRMRGSLIQMLVDGAVLFSVTDPAITAAGVAGIRLVGPATSAIGTHVGAWQVRQ